MSPIYEYECDSCEHRFEELRPMGDGEIPECPECGGFNVRRLFSSFSFGFKKKKDDGGIVLGESGKLGRKVSTTDLEHLEEGVRVDAAGRPRYTPTRPKPRFA